jgi:hypothetical protein
MNGKLEEGCDTVVLWTKLGPVPPSGGTRFRVVPPSGGTEVVEDGPAPPWVV